MQSSNKPYVYISYSLDDRSTAELIASHLRYSGVKVWLDKTDLRQGDSFEDQIKDALSQCTHFLLITGSSSSSSKWVQAELSAIETRYSQSSPGSLQIIPVILPGANVNELPVFINKFTWLGFPESIDVNVFFERLLAMIRAPFSEPSSDNASDNQGAANPESNLTNRKKLKTIKTIRLPDIDWVEIPAGSFIYVKESSRLTVNLERYFISRYPITNCQYQTFIDAGSYDDERWWQELTKQEPEKPAWAQANRPRENVSWNEALAFTRWLSGQLGYDITLPTEQQWEKAARGSEWREYPWGNDIKSGYANVDDPSIGEDNLQQTTAVGMFPDSQSPHQVMDMAGNVWEWCLNKYNSPEYIMPDQSNDERVLRGGCWGSNIELCRCSVRNAAYANNRIDFIGFRVVCSTPFAESFGT